MSHLIVEIPKGGPFKGSWIHVVAENWIEDQVLYLPDARFSSQYKNTMLKGGVPPNVENWDRHDEHDEARTNLPRVESGLPILNDSNTGRGLREKKLSLPGETTTDMESDEEESVGPSCRKLASTMQKKTSPKSSFRGGTSLPLPPTGLLIAKRSNNLSSTATQGNTVGRLHTEASSSTVDFSTQEVFQPGTEASAHITQGSPSDVRQMSGSDVELQCAHFW
ncbi:hypothetical protein OUZ56_010644 [Daphnia magna]|uniref:BRCT domain-containing protein n=1 Tax=Daphnia magna TaxID=35525 RepID=A0ABR0AJ45_9CRUS|nr:hypothetical protein OUZ56_010644 [Daphnia magna]